MNLLQNISSDELGDLKWLNKPSHWEKSGDGILVSSGDYTDFFVDPAGKHMKDDAPYLYLDIEGDFVAKALVKPSFNAVWNAATLLVRADSANWGKLAYEWSDAGDGYRGIVSVVTKGTSDDANGPPVSQGEVWLQICRSGNIFTMFWSTNGNQWQMARLFALECGNTVSIGLAAQSPAGLSATHEFKTFTVEKRTISDLRKGI
jgi:uncharacterized protein